MKTCSKCGTEKPETELFFSYYNKKKKTFRAECKICQRDYQRKYCRDNPEKVKAASRRYYKKNKEKVNAATLKYFKANPEKRRAYTEKQLEKKKRHDIATGTINAAIRGDTESIYTDPEFMQSMGLSCSISRPKP